MELGNQWQRSTRCDNSGPNCVEVKLDGGNIRVRDSKRVDQEPLTFTPGEWNAFLEGAAQGDFKLPV